MQLHVGQRKKIILSGIVYCLILGIIFLVALRNFIIFNRKFAHLPQAWPMVLFFVIAIGFLLTLSAFLWWNFTRIFEKIEDIRLAVGRVNQGSVARGLDNDLCHHDTQNVLHVFQDKAQGLAAAQERLIAANRLTSLGILASSTVHQLNNPLHNIFTSSQIAQAEVGEGDLAFMKRLLATIGGEAERARCIVRGLLEYAGERQLNVEPTSLAEVAARAVRLAQAEAPPGITINSYVPDGVILPLDAGQMTEALLNLLINAIQAIDSPGSISLTAEILKNRSLGIIKVRDTGQGIESADFPSLFDPFFSTKLDGGGTGLGLAVVQGIVLRHGGSIRVESEKGRGSVFIIALPLTREAE